MGQYTYLHKHYYIKHTNGSIHILTLIFDDTKAKFYRAFKAIMGKVGRISLQVVTHTLVKSKCVATLLYCLKDCQLNTMDIKSLEYPITRAFFKIFQTNSNEIIEECKRSF